MENTNATKHIAPSEEAKDEKPQHTPGPWKVRAGTFCEDGVPSYEVVMPGEPCLNALDARLIAAAPELLAALIAMDDLVESLWPSVDWGKTFNLDIAALNSAPLKAKAAIAKAKGESK